MRKIGIVTDSTAYLPATTIKLLGIKVVPLIVQWNGKSYFEADPNATDVINALRKGELATTSRPKTVRAFTIITTTFQRKSKNEKLTFW